jgi:hypothetical protein
MGALHEVNASYYSPLNALQSAPSTTGAGGVGHPGDKWGWAAGVGIKINTPFITQGDWFQAQANFTQGALRYVFNTPNTNWGKVESGKEAYGVLSDCVYAGTIAVGNTTGCLLTSAWGINAGYEHYWTPAWHTSLYGAYAQVSYGKGTGSANANLLGNWLRQRSCRYAGCRRCGLQQRLVAVGHRLPYSVGRHQDVLPGRGSPVLAVEQCDDRNRLCRRSGRLRLLRLRRRDCERSSRLQLGGQHSRSPRLPALIA